MVICQPVEICFDADDEPVPLIVGTDLAAASGDFARQAAANASPMARVMKAQYGSFIEKAAVSIPKARIRKI